MYQPEERWEGQPEVDGAEVIYLAERGRMLDTINILEDENRELREAMELMKPVFAIGVDVRRRLFAQVKDPRESGDAEIIKQGNFAAHRGRPRADAVLCVRVFEPREEACEIYTRLYGVDPRWALTWIDFEGMDDVLECRGSLVAAKISLSTTFDELFKQFIYRVEECGEDGAAGEDVSSVYYDILKEYDQLVAGIPGKRRMRST